MNSSKLSYHSPSMVWMGKSKLRRNQSYAFISIALNMSIKTRAGSFGISKDTPRKLIEFLLSTLLYEGCRMKTL
ncbi:hypothetical protein EXIGUO9Y_190047 [Exiguobacterium oxidotolerans]|uniref:Uncharacterized protein n=1 Tax=Exiguobacterium oxidotolerans TaxID=223958 RepID=A0A653I6S2_9BACL|nr:hypothetical protein EXIGUO9Y_190047 [Exiguobacterium oxidotolerans]